MIDFEEELKKFQFSLEVEDAEEAINSLSREVDMADLLLKMMEKTQKEEKKEEDEEGVRHGLL